MMKKSFQKFVLILVFLVPHIAFAADTPPFSFVVIGDSGCGCSEQGNVAASMINWYSEKPYQVVLMLGDNIYGRNSDQRGGNWKLFVDRFDKYYQPLRQFGVKFFAVLGNHDMETRDGRDLISDRVRFNILGKKGYYSFSPEVTEAGSPLITFFGLHSPSLKEGEEDTEQLAWISRSLADDKAIWKIPFFHHPIYTPPGKHDEEEEFKIGLEPVIVAAGVKVTFAGHNHFYARMKPQKGVVHFVSGGGGRTLKTPIPDDQTAVALKTNHFIYVEVYPDRLDYWAVPPTGIPFDHGSIER